MARGRTVGYRCLLAPDFLAETRQHGIISDTVTGEALAAGAVGLATVPVADVGPVTLAYRVRRVTAADLRDPDGVPAPDDVRRDRGPVTDEYGRPLELLYGILCVTPSIHHAGDLDLLAARAAALRTYRRFLADEAGFTVEPSTPFPVRSTMLGAAAPMAPPPAAEPPPRPPADSGRKPVRPPPRSRPRTASIVGALLAGALAVVVWMAIGPLQPVKGVAVEGPTPVSADCRRPVDLVVNATVTTRRSAEVTYRWEGSHNTDGRAHQLTFEGGATKPVSTTLVVTGSPGEEITGEQRLVVDEPNRRADSVRFVVRCDG